jgi:two-component system, NarL family, response regulator LiaR
MHSSAPIRVLIVDDHPAARRGLAFAFQTFADLELVGEAGSGSAALILCARLRPDVVLMDPMMPGAPVPVTASAPADAGGVTAIRALKQHFPGIQVLVLTSFVTKELIQAALAAGACGYLLKDTSREDLAQAIRMTSAGHATLAPAATQALLASPPAPPGAMADLTARAQAPVGQLIFEEGAPPGGIGYLLRRLHQHAVARLEYRALRDARRLDCGHHICDTGIDP